MLISLTLGAKEIHFLDSSMEDYKGAGPQGLAGDRAAAPPHPPFTLDCPPPPPLPPPPPPPPPNAPPAPETCVFQKFGARRRSKLRNFNWDAIPQERVRGRRSLWTIEQSLEDLQIDTGRIEELFARHEEEPVARHRSWRAQRSQSLAETPVQKIALLDPKRCMNIGIFLKQFKRSAPEIVEDIRRGSGERYCGERLAELIKHLPEKEEVKRLTSFRGDRSNLSEAELFLALLLDVPSYTLRLEAMTLRKQFPATVVGLRASARVLKDSAQELLGCSELHVILRLVLKAGNFMNAGGYAGNAAGFHISSLLKLADTKANKPGMSLLHFVAMEVQKRYPELLCFPGKLENISRGNRLSEGGVVEEFCRLQSQVSSLVRTLEAAEHKEIRAQMVGFLQGAEDQLEEVQKEMEALRASRQQLLEFLCEDEETFKLEECCQIFSNFCDKFLKALQENKEREMEEQRRQHLECARLEKRRSTATCSTTEDHSGRDDLALTLERSLRAACRYGSLRRANARSPTINPARVAYFSCQGPWVRRDREQDTEPLSDEENARQLREVSETVLSQQMGYGVSPAKKGRSRSDIAKWPPVQPALSENSSELHLGNTRAQPELPIQPSSVPDLSRTSGRNLPSSVSNRVPSEINGQLLTKNISARPDISSYQCDGSVATRPDFSTHPPTRNIPPKPKLSISPSTEYIQPRSEVNNPPLTGFLPSKPQANNQSLTGNTPDGPTVNNNPSIQNMPAGPKVSNQESIVNKPARLEGNNQPLTGNKPARPEMNNQCSTANKPVNQEVSNQPLTKNKLARPEVNNHPSTLSMPERPEVNRQSSAANKPARPEVIYQPSPGSMLAGTEVDHQPATSDIKTQSSTGSMSTRPNAATGYPPLRPEISIKPSTGITTTRSLGTGPILAEFPRVGETVECRSLVKGLKSYENLAVQKAPPSPCAKWKREQQGTCEKGQGEHSNPLRTADRIRGQGPILKIQKGKDLLKDPEPGCQRTSTFGTAREGEVGVRRVHSAKERSSVTAGALDGKGQKPPSSPVDHLSSPLGARPSTLSRRATLPRSFQNKGNTTAPSEGWKGGGAKARKETQTMGSGNVKELDKDRGSCYTLRPSLTSSRKTVPRADSVQHRNTSVSPVSQKGPVSPRPDSVTAPKLVTTPPVARRVQVSPKAEPMEVPRRHAPSPVALGNPTSSKTLLGSTKKPRAVAPMAAKVVKHCEPVPGAGSSQAERSRRTSSQPIWR